MFSGKRWTRFSKGSSRYFDSLYSKKYLSLGAWRSRLPYCARRTEGNNYLPFLRNVSFSCHMSGMRLYRKRREFWLFPSSELKIPSPSEGSGGMLELMLLGISIKFSAAPAGKISTSITDRAKDPVTYNLRIYSEEAGGVRILYYSGTQYITTQPKLYPYSDVTSSAEWHRLTLRERNMVIEFNCKSLETSHCP